MFVKAMYQLHLTLQKFHHLTGMCSSGKANFGHVNSPISQKQCCDLRSIKVLVEPRSLRITSMERGVKKYWRSRVCNCVNSFVDVDCLLIVNVKANHNLRLSRDWFSSIFFYSCSKKAYFSCL